MKFLPFQSEHQCQPRHWQSEFRKIPIVIFRKSVTKSGKLRFQRHYQSLFQKKKSVTFCKIPPRPHDHVWCNPSLEWTQCGTFLLFDAISKCVLLLYRTATLRRTIMSRRSIKRGKKPVISICRTVVDIIFQPLPLL